MLWGVAGWVVVGVSGCVGIGLALVVAGLWLLARVDEMFSCVYECDARVSALSASVCQLAVQLACLNLPSLTNTLSFIVDMVRVAKHIMHACVGPTILWFSVAVVVALVHRIVTEEHIPTHSTDRQTALLACFCNLFFFLCCPMKLLNLSPEHAYQSHVATTPAGHLQTLCVYTLHNQQNPYMPPEAEQQSRSGHQSIDATLERYNCWTITAKQALIQLHNNPTQWSYLACQHRCVCHMLHIAT